MSLFIKRSLGINIRERQVSLVAQQRFLGRVRYLGSATVALPDGQPHALTDMAGKWPASLHLRRPPDEIVLGLPRSCLVLRILEIPSVDAKDLAGLLAYELERHLPFSQDEACYAFQRLRQAQGKVTVLLAAVKRVDLERIIESVEGLGIRPTLVDVSALAGANAVLYTRTLRNGDGALLIEHDGWDAEVSLVRDGSLASSRAIALRAESVDALLEEVRRVSEPHSESAMTVLLSGSNAEVGWRFAGKTELPIEPWSAEFAAVEASTYGLALKGLKPLPLQLDLLPRDRRGRKREPALSLLWCLLALIAVLGASLGFSSAYRERTALQVLDAQLHVVKTRVERVQALKSEVTNLRAQIQALERLDRERGRPLLVWKDLVQLLPTDVTLTDVTLDGGKLQIRGTAGASASGLIGAFEKSSLFENSAFTSPIAAQGHDRYAFQLQAYVKESNQRPAARKQP